MLLVPRGKRTNEQYRWALVAGSAADDAPASDGAIMAPRSADRQERSSALAVGVWPANVKCGIVLAGTKQPVGSPVPSGCIELRGVAVHNLKQVDLDIPYRRLV